LRDASQSGKKMNFDGLAFPIDVELRTYVLLAGQVEEGCDMRPGG
jgi:hypothetical protein